MTRLILSPIFLPGDLKDYAARCVLLFPGLHKFTIEDKIEYYEISFPGESEAFEIVLSRMKATELDLQTYHLSGGNFRPGKMPCIRADRNAESEISALLHTIPERLIESLKVEDLIEALKKEKQGNEASGENTHESGMRQILKIITGQWEARGETQRGNLPKSASLQSHLYRVYQQKLRPAKAQLLAVLAEMPELGPQTVQEVELRLNYPTEAEIQKTQLHEKILCLQTRIALTKTSSENLGQLATSKKLKQLKGLIDEAEVLAGELEKELTPA